MMSFHYTKPQSKADSHLYGKGFVAYDDSDSPEIMAEIALSHAWSPIIFKDGIRRGSHFLKANWLVLDFDDGKFTLEQAAHEFKDMWHWIGTTWSHTPEKHKFRVALKWTMTIEDAEQYTQNVAYALKYYPADKQCKDPARYFFPSKELISCSTGAQADVWDKVVERPRPVEIDVAKSRVMPVKIAARLSEKWLEGDRNRTTFIVAKEMLKRGFTKDEIIARVCELNDFGRAEIVTTVVSAERNLRNEEREKSKQGHEIR